MAKTFKVFITEADGHDAKCEWPYGKCVCGPVRREAWGVVLRGGRTYRWWRGLLPTRRTPFPGDFWGSIEHAELFKSSAAAQKAAIELEKKMRQYESKQDFETAAWTAKWVDVESVIVGVDRSLQ